jgi:predicted nucleic acid-binding protein
MTIVDSSVWIDFVHRKSTPHTAWLQENIVRERIGVTDLILSEVLQGTRDKEEFRRTLDRFLLLPIFPCAGTSMAVASARNYSILRSRGITVRRTIDCFIATFCITQGYALLHHDRDFDHFEREFGLRVVKV